MTRPNPLADFALTEAEDLDLVRLVQSGDEETLNVLVDRNHRSTTRPSYHMAVKDGNPHESRRTPGLPGPIHN